MASMNRGEMRTYLEGILANSLGETGLWSDTFENDLIEEALQATANALPIDVLDILWKTDTCNMTNAQTEYGIEGADFNLTDYQRWVRLRIWDGTELQEAKIVPPDVIGSSNFLYQASKYNPIAAIGARTADAADRAFTISPASVEDKANGLELIYICRLNTLPTDNDVSILPPEYHEDAMHYAAAVALVKAEKDALSLSEWAKWRNKMLLENAKYGRRVSIPEEPTV